MSGFVHKRSLEMAAYSSPCEPPTFSLSVPQFRSEKPYGGAFHHEGNDKPRPPYDPIYLTYEAPTRPDKKRIYS
jgi:hypothetical protein